MIAAWLSATQAAWVALVGVALQVVGLTLAVLGVREQHRLLAPQPFRWRDAFSEASGEVGSAAADRAGAIRSAAQSAWRRLRPGKGAPIGAASAVSRSFSGAAKARSEPERPDDDAPTAEQLDYVMRKIDLIDKRLIESDEAVREVTDHSGRIEGEVARISAELDVTTTAISGREGHALRRTALGLLLTGVGVFLTVAAPLQSL